ELPRRLTAGEALDSLRVLQELLQQWDCWNCFVEQVRKRFDLLSATSDVDREPVLFTGYYQPIIDASLGASEEFRFPLYRTPGDLVTADQVNAAPTEPGEKTIGRL